MTEAGTDTFPIFAGNTFIEPARSIVARWKDHGRRDVSELIFGHAQQLGEECARFILLDHSYQRVREVWIVFMPSSRSATVHRGFIPAEVVARGVATGLNTAGLSAHIFSGVRVRGNKNDQVGLSVMQRRRNVSGKFYVPHRLTQRFSKDTLVLFVDDVVTTASTLFEVRRQFHLGSGTLAAGLALFATPKS
ncbi:ComF family protein [Timonella sp. A28]|uniref:ComF family protein n=1 Tax=Timonella sp. A28 TaxID=3442640 RepID=UPI003EBE84E9